MSSNSKYAACYLCEEVVYLYKKVLANASTSASTEFYRRHMAIVRRGFVLCPRCHRELSQQENNKRQNENCRQ
uniref:DekiORF108 n=1 Tax=Dendrolimus kikuchii nucleopolyhedrovirus TaxID=1219875 RepID=V9LT02_9ABAC|nr:DekiORF108 [Dendrolimus kikuchii nucleopolyhedrovirus]